MSRGAHPEFWLATTGRALRHPNYRLFFFGQGISLIGTWLTRVAMSWLVYRLTGSALVLGIVAFAGQLPTFFLAPIGSLAAGWLGDHIGAPETVRLGGVATLVGVALFIRRLPHLRRLARPVYVRLGILPE